MTSIKSKLVGIGLLSLLWGAFLYLPGALGTLHVMVWIMYAFLPIALIIFAEQVVPDIVRASSAEKWDNDVKELSTGVISSIIRVGYVVTYVALGWYNLAIIALLVMIYYTPGIKKQFEIFRDVRYEYDKLVADGQSFYDDDAKIIEIYKRIKSKK